MLKTRLQEQEFFTHHGVMSDPGRYANLLQDLTSDLPGLVQTVQGLLVHIFWAERHGLKLAEQRQAEVQIRTVERKIHLADITIPGQEDFAEIRRLYADEPRLRVPEGWQV